MSQSKSQVKPRKRQDNAQSIKRLLASPGVIFWLKGHWNLRTDRDGKSRVLSPRLREAFEHLKAEGKTTEQAPGYFRCGAAATKPISNDLESPLARLVLLKSPDGQPYIDRQQYEAGERLRRDFERTQLAARTTANYDASTVSGGRHWQMGDNTIARLTDNAIAARQRLHAALEAVGPELSGMIYHVCCLAGGLEQAEQRLELPRRAGKVVLALALTRLARHYGLKPDMKHAGPRTIGHWAVADFKPEIAPPGPHQT